MDVGFSHKNQEPVPVAKRSGRLSFYQEWICHELKQYVASWAVKYIEPVFAGDIDAAASLAVAARNAERGVIVVALWQAKVPVPAFRELLQAVWEHDHQELIWAAETRRRLRAIFRYATFEIPELPSKFQVWRGTKHLSPKLAARGYSWTLDRDVACWFAMRFARESSNPLVLTAWVAKESIAFYSDEREEREVVLFNPPMATIDGNPGDWAERFTVKSAARHAKTLAEMAEHGLS